MIDTYKNLIKKIMAAAQEPKREPPPQHVVEMHKKAFAEIKEHLGSSVEEIFSKERSVGREKIADALSYIASWKSWNELPMSDAERAFMGRTDLFAEVNNGGFHQYFFNSSGDNWHYLLQAFEKSGDTNAVQRFREVLSIFPQSTPDENRQKRWKQLEDLESALGDKMWAFFNKQDEAFYDSPFPDPEKFWAYFVSERTKINVVWI